ncbi:uncharacterized protein LOC112689255 [Sipha flava]|uniref:Uncharacterized protein LOC112689255 n=1 Tax=Sipha flava TaxID=143950 RepID=A0A8B8G602_9HEMI|nr:uncharacterized protein LOC112689255 [Sipha flava]
MHRNVRRARPHERASTSLPAADSLKIIILTPRVHARPYGFAAVRLYRSVSAEPQNSRVVNSTVAATKHFILSDPIPYWTTGDVKMCTKQIKLAQKYSLIALAVTILPFSSMGLRTVSF